MLSSDMNDTPSTSTSMLGVLLSSLIMSSIPASVLLVTTLLGLLYGTQGLTFQLAQALQQWGTGILYAVIAVVIVPLLIKEIDEWQDTVAIIVGSCLGVGLLWIAVHILVSQQKPTRPDDDEDETNNDTVANNSATTTAVSSRRQSVLGVSLTLSTRHTLSDPGRMSTEQDTLLSSSSSEPTQQQSPSSSSSLRKFVTVLMLYCGLGGLLIGISSAQNTNDDSNNDGPLMAGSLSFEMLFFGLSLSSALHGTTSNTATTTILNKTTLSTCLAGPLTILLGCVLATLILSETVIDQDSVLGLGLCSLVTSSILYLVTDELLLEAKEVHEPKWWSNLPLCLGFGVGVLVCLSLPDD